MGSVLQCISDFSHNSSGVFQRRDVCGFQYTFILSGLRVDVIRFKPSDFKDKSRKADWKNKIHSKNICCFNNCWCNLSVLGVIQGSDLANLSRASPLKWKSSQSFLSAPMDW